MDHLAGTPQLISTRNAIPRGYRHTSALNNRKRNGDPSTCDGIGMSTWQSGWHRPIQRGEIPLNALCTHVGYQYSSIQDELGNQSSLAFEKNYCTLIQGKEGCGSHSLVLNGHTFSLKNRLIASLNRTRCDQPRTDSLVMFMCTMSIDNMYHETI